MKKFSLTILTILILTLTACGNASASADPASAAQSGTSAGELSASMQVAIGTIKLEETENAVTAEQAAELLPLWQTLEVLYASDTAAPQEIDALMTQIQETMTAEQTQAISALNLTRQDMMSIMQSQGLTMGSGQGGNTQSGNATNNSGGGFGPGGDELQRPPPDGGFPGGGGPNFQGQRNQSADSTDGTTTIDPNRIPTPVINAVIEYLKEKAGS